MNILFLSTWFPWPPDNGNKIRVLNLLRALSDRHRVTLVSARVSTSDDPAEGTELQELCEDVLGIPWWPRPPQGLPRFLSYVSPKPTSGWVIAEHSADMQRAVAERAQSGRYDLVIANRLPVAAYADAFGDLPALLEEVELGGYASAFGQDRSLMRRYRGRAFYWKLRRAVARLLGRFAACTVASREELRLLKDAVPSYEPVDVIPNCLDYRAYEGIRPERQPHSLIFTGSLTFSANYEAMEYFLEEIYPLIRKRLPDSRVRITGRHDDLRLPGVASGSPVELTGYVDDVKPLIAQSQVSIAPLLTGGGTRFKILEAMALGTPVVSTSKGAEGLQVKDGRHLVIADRPREFAEAVVRICQDEAFRDHLAREGRRLVAEEYDWSAVAPRFLRLIERVAEGETGELDASI